MARSLPTCAAVAAWIAKAGLRRKTSCLQSGYTTSRISPLGRISRNQEARSGRVIRFNEKTVTLDCVGQQWRVAYGLLQRVVDTDWLVMDGVEILGPSR